MIVRLFIYIENDIFIDNENEIILIEQLRSIFLLKNKNIIYIYIFAQTIQKFWVRPRRQTNML